jgi:predicted HD phosphohydrolase
METQGMNVASFTRMEDGTREDFQFISRQFHAHVADTLVDNLFVNLKRMQGPTLGYKIDRYQHSLQSATRALRDQASEELVVAALLHDVGDVIAPENHSEVAAAILRPYVSEETWWIVKHHGVFQGYYFWEHIDLDPNSRERYRGQEHFQACADFCEKWDQNCFDPDYDSLPLETFEPMVRRVFAEVRSPYA